MLPCTGWQMALVLQEPSKDRGCGHSTVSLSQASHQNRQDPRPDQTSFPPCYSDVGFQLSPIWRIREALPRLSPRAQQHQALQSPKGCKGLVHVPWEELPLKKAGRLVCGVSHSGPQQGDVSDGTM